MLLSLPALLHVHRLLGKFGQFNVECTEAILAGSISFFRERDFFNLQLHDAAFHHVNFGGHRIDFNPQLAGRFVHKVNCLVRQEPIGEIPVGKYCCTHQRVVLNPHAVVHFVAFLQATQNCDGVLHRRFTHIHLLKAALQCGIFFNVGAVFIECCCTNHSQLTARQHRLNHVARIDGPVRASGAHQSVNLVDERNDFATGVDDLFEHRFQAFFELATIFCARQHGCNIKRHQSL